MRLLKEKQKGKRGAWSLRLIFFLWGYHGFSSCQFQDQPDVERSLFPSPSTSFKIHPNKDQSSDSWGLHRAGCELSPLGPLCGLVSVEDFFFPLQEAQLLPHCQVLAGYYGNRSQEGSAFLPSWMRSRGLCEGQCFPLHGQENWLWVMGLT